MVLLGQLPQPLVMRVLEYLGFNSLFVLGCTSKRGWDLCHKALLTRGVLFFRADGRDTGMTWRVLRRGMGFLRLGDGDYDGAEPLCKIVCVGEPLTGKTAFVRCFAHEGEYSEGALLPVEPPHVVRACMVNVGGAELPLMRLMVCDMPEDAQLRRRLCYAGCHVALLMYSDRSSFVALGKWAEEVKEHVGQRVVVVQNKSDTGEASVPEEEARQLATGLGGTFVKSSAKRSSNVVLAVRLACIARFRPLDEEEESEGKDKRRNSAKCSVQ